MNFLKFQSLFFLLVLPIWITAQSYTVRFELDATTLQNPQAISIRGNTPPLSWEKDYPLTDPDHDGIYTATLTFQTSKNWVEYKYRHHQTWELDEKPNRFLTLAAHNQPIREIWNQNRPLSTNELEAVKISVADWQKDVEILRKAFLQLHPGLLRYNTTTTLEQHFETLRNAVQRPVTLAQAYLEISKFTAKIKCGHTFANFWNQPSLVQLAILEQPDKLPFAFQLVEKRLFITLNASQNPELERGTEILAINGVATSEILSQTAALVAADGDRMAKRLNELQLTGMDSYEAFDVYFPLLFPPMEGKFDLLIRNLKTGETRTTTVFPMSRTERNRFFLDHNPTLPKSYDDLWEFKILDEKMAYLKLGTFVTYKMKMDWKGFLKSAFEQVKSLKINHLVLDIRGNAGGMDEVILELARYLVTENITLEPMEDRLGYAKVSDDLRPYLRTWDESYFNLEKKVKPLANSGFTWKKNTSDGQKIYAIPSSLKFKGKTYLLIDASNSSATFLLAKALKQAGLATLVGQTTGGNQRGINGGMMFFLNLPYSMVEVDIPLIGGFPLLAKPDNGIEPDFFVPTSVAAVENDEDGVLNFAKSLIFKDLGLSQPLKQQNLEALKGNFEGSLEYLEFEDDRTLVRLNCRMEATTVENGQQLKIIFEEKNQNGEPMTNSETIAVSKNGQEIILFNDQETWQVLDYQAFTNEKIIIAEKKGTDNNRPATLRMTIWWNEAGLAWSKMVRYDGAEDFFTRNTFRFQRTK